MLNKARQLTNDRDKYQAAVDMARMKMNDMGGSRGNPFGNDFKRTIDDYYGRMTGGKKGGDIRGDNIFTDAIDGLNGLINGFNVGIGNAADAVFDNTVGNVAGLAGEGLGNTVKNLFTGEDLAIIPDVAEDVLLYAVAPPAALAKNAIQMSPYMSDFVSGLTSGKSAVTQEDVNGWQTAANGLLGIGGTALAALPMAGQAKNIIEATGRSVSPVGESAFRDALKKSGLSVDDALERTGAKNARQAIDIINNIDSLKGPKSASSKDVQKAIEALETVPQSAIENVPDEAFDMFSKAAKLDAAAQRGPQAPQIIDRATADAVKEADALSAAADAARAANGDWENMTRFDRAIELMRQNRKALGESLLDDPVEIVHERRVGRKNSRKEIKDVVKDLNKEIKEGKLPEDFNTGKEFQTRVLGKYADDLGVEVTDLTDDQIAEAARRYGLDSLEEVPVKDLGVIDNMRISSGARDQWKNFKDKVAKGEALDANGDPVELSDKLFRRRAEKRDIVNTAREAARSGALSKRPVDFAQIGGRHPLRNFKSDMDAVLDNILEKANIAAPASTLPGLDYTGLRGLGKNAKLARSGKEQGANIAKAYGLRAADMLGGFGASGLGAGAGIMAETGVAPHEVFSKLNDYVENRGEGSAFGAVAPLLIPGSKNFSRRAVPGIMGAKGMSMAPHNVARGLGSAKAMHNLMDEYDWDPQSYNDVLGNIFDTYEEERGEE